MTGSGSERGATLVEYTLLIALVALVTLGAIDTLGAVVMDSYERTGGTWSSGGAQDSDGGSDGADGPDPQPEPPSPPATTAPTTTAPVVASAGFGAVDSTSSSWFRWEGSAEVRVTDSGGAPVAGARVEVRVSVPGGSVQTITVTTAADGSVTVEVGPYDWWSGVSRVEVEILSVEADGLSWDGAGPTTVITRQ